MWQPYLQSCAYQAERVGGDDANAGAHDAACHHGDYCRLLSSCSVTSMQPRQAGRMRVEGVRTRLVILGETQTPDLSQVHRLSAQSHFLS